MGKGNKYTTCSGEERSVDNAIGVYRESGRDTNGCKEVKEGFGKRLYDEED